jgi:O-antigen/teichoic acid export membrane protein
VTGRSRRRAAAVTFLFNYSSVGFGVIYGVVFVPLYLHYLGLATYGAWLASGNIIAMLGGLDGGLSMVFAQRLALSHGQGDRARISRLVGSGFALFAAIGGSMIVLSCALARWIPAWVQAPPADRRSLTLGIALAGIGAALSLARTTIANIPLAWQRATIPGFSQLASQLAMVIVIPVALWSGAGVLALGLGTLASGLVGAVIAGAFVVVEWKRERLDRLSIAHDELRDLVWTTLPLLASRVLNMVGGNAESLIVAATVNPAAAAILSITSRAYQVAMSLVNPVAGASYSGMAHLAGEGSRERLRSSLQEILQISVLLTALMIPAAFALNEMFIRLWVGSDKFGGQWLNCLLFVSALLIVRTNLLGMLVPALGELRGPAWIGTAEFACRLALMLLFLPRVGLAGMPLAALLANSATSLWFLSWRTSAILHLRARAALRLHLTGGVPLAIACALALGIWRLTLSFNGWTSFVAFSALTALTLAAAITLASPYARGLFARLSGGLWSVAAPG